MLDSVGIYPFSPGGFADQRRGFFVRVYLSSGRQVSLVGHREMTWCRRRRVLSPTLFSRATTIAAQQRRRSRRSFPQGPRLRTRSYRPGGGEGPMLPMQGELVRVAPGLRHLVPSGYSSSFPHILRRAQCEARRQLQRVTPAVSGDPGVQYVHHHVAVPFQLLLVPPAAQLLEHRQGMRTRGCPPQPSPSPGHALSGRSRCSGDPSSP